MAVKKIVKGSAKQLKILNFDPSQPINIVEKGVYRARLKNIEMAESVTTKMGLTSRIKATFELLDDGRLVFQNILLLPGQAQLIGQLIFAVAGKYTQVDLFKLIGSEVGVEIEHNTTKQGMLVPNVVSIFNVDEVQDDDNYSDSSYDTSTNNSEEYEDEYDEFENTYEEVEC